MIIFAFVSISFLVPVFLNTKNECAYERSKFIKYCVLLSFPTIFIHSNYMSDEGTTENRKDATTHLSV
jgi:hypothetical protein